MKKLLVSVLALLMICSFALVACTNQPADVENDANVQDDANTPALADKIVLATGGNTGTYYAYGMAMGQILQDKTGITFDVQSTGASKANIQLIQVEEADMAVVQNDVMYYAYTGTDLFAGAQTQDFSAVATLYPELCQIIASKSSGIASVADLKGKRVSVGDAGSGVEFNAKQILAAYGIDMDKDIEKQNLGFGPSADALKDEKIDAFFCVAGIPTTAITDLAMSNEITVVPVDDDKFAELSAQYGFYTQQVVPAGTYAGMTEDVKTVAVMATYIVDNDLSEDTVYAITKAMFENKDAIAAAHVKGAELDAAKAVQGIPEVVPFHAGALKYFKEAGIIAE
ncbi:MAG: TAXI family TRAP transporter solute-binding subunit [Ruminococcaceae bacterium]|nr:TAXI family TRAP transporter solute-binding subunit [Oscillospiraceae bacterium]